MKKSRDGSRSRKKRIKKTEPGAEKRNRIRRSCIGSFPFPEESKASAMQMRSRSRRTPFHGDWGKDPNKQKRLGSTQTLLAK
jgi:hypothetical protein